MAIGITVLLVTAIYFAVFRVEILTQKRAVNPVSAASMSSYIFITAASIAMKLSGFDPRLFLFAAWVLAAVIEYKKELKNNTLSLAFFLIFGLTLLSFFMLPYSKFTAYAFPVSGVIFLLFAAEMHKDVFIKSGPVAAYLFTLAAAFTIKFQILAHLPEWMSVPVTVLAALFITVRKSKGAEHYLDEKIGIKTAAIFYAALILQLFVAAILKNPLFN